MLLDQTPYVPEGQSQVRADYHLGGDGAISFIVGRKGVPVEPQAAERLDVRLGVPVELGSLRRSRKYGSDPEDSLPSTQIPDPDPVAVEIPPAGMPQPA